MKWLQFIILFFIAVLGGSIFIAPANAQLPILLTQSQPLQDEMPKLTVTKKDNPAPGEILLSTYQFSNMTTYLLIVDNNGNALYHLKLDSGGFDFNLQNNLYTYFDDLSLQNYASQKPLYLGVPIDSFKAEGKYHTDGHEFRLKPDGGYVLLATSDTIYTVNNKPLTVAAGVLQEFNADKKLIFQWRTADYFQLKDALYEDTNGNSIDFTHCNAVELEGDTAYLLSSRNLSEITKISKTDSHIIWRFGGARNQFRIIGDSVQPFSYQHAVRRLRNGNIVLFDNGTYSHVQKPYSRAVEYQLDEKNLIATKVWEYRHTPDVQGDQFGYIHELDNGNRLICWCTGANVALTEVKPDGTTALEMKFDSGVYSSYRAYKYDLQAKGVQASPLVSELSLDQNYPNPCVSSSVITFHLSGNSPVSLRVYDALGRQIKTLFDGTVLAGSYSARFDGMDLPSGTYFYRLSTPGKQTTKMMEVTR